MNHKHMACSIKGRLKYTVRRDSGKLILTIQDLDTLKAKEASIAIASTVDPVFSPDRKKIACVDANNLYMIHIGQFGLEVYEIPLEKDQKNQIEGLVWPRGNSLTGLTKAGDITSFNHKAAAKTKPKYKVELAAQTDI